VFQNQGYFGAVVKSLRIKPSDQLAIPEPATLEAEVLEGQRYKLSEIRFTGNRVFGAAKLRSVFPLKRGDLFERDKIAGGLNGLRKLYTSEGFVGFAGVSETQTLSDATIVLSLSITEGPQYRMGKLEILAQKEMADRLREEWQLPEGAAFDLSYIDEYIGANRFLLPLGFTARDVQLVRDCPGASIEVRLVLEVTDPSSQSRPKDVESELPNNASK
jgi:outer membrane protein assembly factor BamA